MLMMEVDEGRLLYLGRISGAEDQLYWKTSSAWTCVVWVSVERREIWQQS